MARIIFTSTNSSSSGSDSGESLTIVAIIGTALFGLLACYHIFLCVKQKAWFFWMMVLAGLMETSAFATRLDSTLNPQETRKYLVSYLLFILSPSIMTVALFSTFTRITWYTTPAFRRKFSTTWIPSGIFKKLFKLAFLASFVTAFVGAGGIVGSATSTDSTTPVSDKDSKNFESSQRMLRAAMIIQATLTGLFGVATFHYTVISRRFIPSTILSSEPTRFTWQRLLWALNGASFFLTVRNVYRVLEFSPDNPKLQLFIQSHEIVFWVFDVIPVIVVFTLLAVTHPSFCLPRPYTTFWFRTGKIEKLEKKMLESQSWSSSAAAAAAAPAAPAPATAAPAPVQNGGPPVTWWMTAQGSDADVERQRLEQLQQQQQQRQQSSTTDPTSVTYQSPAWPRTAHLPARY